MKNRKNRWRLVYLLPLATGIYFKNQLKAKKPWAIVTLTLTLLLILVLVTLPRLSSGENEAKSLNASPSPTVSPSPSPTPEPTPEPISLTLTFAGDCTLGMDDYLGYSGSLNEAYDQNGGAYFLQNVKDIFAQDDLTVVNFEGTLTNSDHRADKTYAFKGEPGYTDILTSASVEVANLANNHTQDYGDQGFSDTKAALDTAHIAHFGFEDTLIMEINGVKVGFTGQFTVYEGPEHLELLQKNIQTLKSQGAQLIIANFHWGLEKDTTPEADQIELAHAAIDAGAHLVIGHHPHVLQGVEVYKGRYICYSLGNFCFGGNANPPDYDCMIFQQTFTLYGDSVEENDAISIIPCSVSSSSGVNDYCPTPAEGSEQERILEKLRLLSDELGDKNIFDP